MTELDTQAALEWVTHAEAQEGGRFTDDAVFYLALAFSIHFLEYNRDYID